VLPKKVLPKKRRSTEVAASDNWQPGAIGGHKITSTIDARSYAEVTGFVCGGHWPPHPWHRNWRPIMRAHYAIAIVAAILVGFSLKLIFFSAPIAEAGVGSVTMRMDISEMHQNIKNLPVEKFHDMTFDSSGGN
jgi:hypothetical protein